MAADLEPAFLARTELWLFINVFFSIKLRNMFFTSNCGCQWFIQPRYSVSTLAYLILVLFISVIKDPALNKAGGSFCTRSHVNPWLQYRCLFYIIDRLVLNSNVRWCVLMLQVLNYDIGMGWWPQDGIMILVHCRLMVLSIELWYWCTLMAQGLNYDMACYLLIARCV